VVLYGYSSDVIADNRNYADVGNYQLELYHNIKHPPSEMLIENKLKELRLPYRKSRHSLRVKSSIRLFTKSG